jgi:hypothetical protein
VTNKLINTLSNFNQLNFGFVQDAILLNRIEKKYLLNTLEFDTILNNLNQDYLCLEINDSIINNYYNTYFDTPDFDFYTQHHNQKPHRLKIRKRYYKTTNTYFLEIKQKNNKRTTKNRMKIFNSNSYLSSDELDFISASTLIYNPAALSSNVQVNYKRLSMINKEFTERLSFDFDIEFVSNNKSIWLKNIVIAECKQITTTNSTFINTIKKNQIPQTSFSKYCIAISKFFPNIKRNNFKQQLTFLEQYFYDGNFNAVTS